MFVDRVATFFILLCLTLASELSNFWIDVQDYSEIPLGHVVWYWESSVAEKDGGDFLMGWRMLEKVENVEHWKAYNEARMKELWYSPKKSADVGRTKSDSEFH